MTRDDGTSDPTGGLTGARRIARAVTNSVDGLKACCRHEEGFRLELLAAVVFVPLGLWLGETGVERALLVGSPLLVLQAELVNSAIEAVVDRVGREPHELSGRAKDLGSAAVLMAIAVAVTTWLLVLGGRWMA